MNSRRSNVQLAPNAGTTNEGEDMDKSSYANIPRATSSCSGCGRPLESVHTCPGLHCECRPRKRCVAFSQLTLGGTMKHSQPDFGRKEWPRTNLSRRAAPSVRMLLSNIEVPGVLPGA